METPIRGRNGVTSYAVVPLFNGTRRYTNRTTIDEKKTANIWRQRGNHQRNVSTVCYILLSNYTVTKLDLSTRKKEIRTSVCVYKTLSYYKCYFDGDRPTGPEIVSCADSATKQNRQIKNRCPFSLHRCIEKKVSLDWRSNSTKRLSTDRTPTLLSSGQHHQQFGSSPSESYHQKL